MRRSLHPSFGQASGVRSALHPSGVPGASGGAPVWTVAPVISGERWPGGTVDGTAGTVSPGTPTYEWEIDAAGTGDTSFATFVPTAAQYSGSLTLVGDASGVTATSNALALQRVRGITRPTATSDRPAGPADLTLGTDPVTLIIEVIGFSSVTNAGWAGALDEGEPTLGSRRGIRILRNSSADSLIARIVTDGVVASTPAFTIPGLTDGTTRYFVMAAYDGSSLLTRRWALAGGATSSASVAASGSMVGAVGNQRLRLAASSTTLGSMSGVIEGKLIGRVLSQAEFEAVVASPIGIASLDGDVDILGEMYPAEGTAFEGDSITTTAEITGCDQLVTETTRLTDGGLNVAV